jgi:cytochrome c oxidase cbb3-type subunit 3
VRAQLIIAVLALLPGCEREQRQFSVPPPEAQSHEPRHTRVEENAYAVSQGKTLFKWFNCSGCHSRGGGGMGAALMSGNWRYGGEIQSIHDSIMNGRPNGMPSFRGRITEDQGWQLAAYVRATSGNVSKDVSSARSDSLSAGKGESRRK